MPIKVTQEDGTEIEALTQEEASALAEQKANEAAAAKEAELSAVHAAEKEKIEAELAGLRDKDYNFQQLRQKAENKGLNEEETKAQIATLTARLDEIARQPVLDTKEEFIKSKIGDDKEKRELFDHYFSRLGADAKSKEEVLRASEEALVLASKGEYKPGESQLYSTGVNQNYRNTTPGVVSEESREIGNLLGVTDEDRKKYGKK